MTIYTCAVADCNSSSRKNDPGVEGWSKFPRKKDPARRRLWERRCKRGPKWKAAAFHAVCSKHFINWCEGPSPSHPDPELFGYNQWRAAEGTENNIGEGRTRCNRHRPRPTEELDVGENQSPTPSDNMPTVTSSVAEPDFYIAVDQEVQVDIHIEVEDINQERSLAAGMFFSYSQDNFHKCTVQYFDYVSINNHYFSHHKHTL